MDDAVLCHDIIPQLIRHSLQECFVVEKIVKAVPEALDYVPEHFLKEDYIKLSKDGYYGVLYAKWMKTGEIPTVDLLKQATILDLVNVFRIYDRYFKNVSSRLIGYHWAIEQCTQLAISFGHTDILNYIYVECRRQLPEHVTNDAYVYGPQEVTDFMFHTLRICPSLDSFYNMMCTNSKVDFTSYIPKEVPLRIVILSYGMCHHKNQKIMDNLEKLKRACSAEDMLFTEDELLIYRNCCELFIPEAQDQLEERNLECTEFHVWKVIEFLWEHFRSYPFTYDLDGLFSDVLYNKDLEGIKFLLETLGWRPEDKERFYDAIFEDAQVAEYVVRVHSDWEDVYEELYG